MLYLTLRFFHILFMATWFGGALMAIRDVKTVFAAGPPHFDLLRGRMKMVGIVTGVSGGITFVLGLVLIFVLGGFGSVPKAIHAGLTTGLATLIVGGAGIGRTWGQIDKGLGEGKTAAELMPLVNRLATFGTIFKALWFVTLILMVFRNVIG